ncbi:MAG: J domain-containing protein [Cyclobacteriaceae bacterium]|jgi:hypothetical protein
MKNYYTILGITVTASEGEVKNAFRKIALQFHPDRNQDPNAEEIFKEANEAYEVLSDPRKKAIYDGLLRQYLEEVLIIRPTPHRDPAYRRTRARPTTRHGGSSRAQLIKQSLPYVHWLCWAGAALALLMALDFLLPYQKSVEHVVSGYTLRGRRMATTFVAITETGKEFRSTEVFMPIGQRVTLKHTVVFVKVMTVTTDKFDIFTGYVYRELAFLPLTLLVASVLGILYKRDSEFAFNASAISGIFLLICLYIIF